VVASHLWRRRQTERINPLEWWEDIVESERLPPLFGERLVDLAAPMDLKG